MDPERLRDLRAGRVAPAPEAGPACPGDDRLAALAEGSLGSAARVEVLGHLAGCARCRAAVASLARLLADPDVGAAMPDPPAGTAAAPWWRRTGVRAVAGLAALLLLTVWTLGPRGEPHRAGHITAAPAPVPVAPVGQVAAAPELRWDPVAGADRYRVTLFDSTGVVRYEVELAGTRASLPDSVRLTPGGRGWWRVEARLGFDRWAASELTEFTVHAEPPR